MATSRRVRDDKGRRLSLLELERDFLRHRSRARRAWRRYQGTSDQPDAAAAHRDWSAAIDDCLRLVETITRQRPSDIPDLYIQYEAVCWWVAEDDSVLDVTTRRWLRRFRGALRELANHSSTADPRSN